MGKPQHIGGIMKRDGFEALCDRMIAETRENPPEPEKEWQMPREMGFERLKKAGVPERMRDCTFDSFDVTKVGEPEKINESIRLIGRIRKLVRGQLPGDPGARVAAVSASVSISFPFPRELEGR